MCNITYTYTILTTLHSCMPVSQISALVASCSVEYTVADFDITN